MQKPILFNTQMVQSIIGTNGGCKTETRRIAADANDGRSPEELMTLCRYKKDDVLYVRETWCKVPGDPPYVYRATCNDGIVRKWKPSIHMPKDAARLFLRVEDVKVERLQDITPENILSEGINIEIPPICKKELTEEEARKMSVLSEQERSEYIETIARHKYMGWLKYADDLFDEWKTIWNGTIKKSDIDRFGWDANPWVYVIKFKKE